MRQVIHISDNKTDAINHLKSQPNMSAYIVNLIEKDMENKVMTKEEVIKLIKEYGGKGENIEVDILDSVRGCLDF